jgi:hypothetical protein
MRNFAPNRVRDAEQAAALRPLSPRVPQASFVGSATTHRGASMTSRTFRFLSSISVVLSLGAACTPAPSNTSTENPPGASGGSSGKGSGGSGGSSQTGTGGSSNSGTGGSGSSAQGGTGGAAAAGGSGGSAASGGTSGGSGGSSGSGGAGGGAADANSGSGDTGAPPSMGNAAELVGKVAKTVFKQTITRYDPDGRSGCGLPASERNQLNEDVLKGDAAKTYDVTFRVRGLMEPRMYQGGMTDPASPFINVGGTPHTGGAENQGQYVNIRMESADPKQVYHLNRFQQGTHTDHQIYPMDYKLKMKVKGGAKISVILADGNACAIANKANKVLEGVPEDVVKQPFKDQFLLVEIDSVAEAP